LLFTLGFVALRWQRRRRAGKDKGKARTEDVEMGAVGKRAGLGGVLPFRGGGEVRIKGFGEHRVGRKGVGGLDGDLGVRF
tara:strand:- start:22269 stop:22508 length:240 start_codon:yes stop_codon:yes gene_type:complete